MRRFLLCVLGMSLLGIQVWAQSQWDSQIDSLKRVSEIGNNDSLQATAYSELAHMYSSVDAKLALDYSERAIQLAQKGNYTSILSDAYNTKGILFSESGKEKDALIYYWASASLAEKNNDKKKIGRAYLNISTIYHQQGRYDIALELNMQALELYEAIEDQLGILDTYVNIANVYASKKELVPAKTYYRKAYKGYREQNDKIGEITTLANLAGILKTENQSDSALYYFEQVAFLCKDENMPYYLALAWEGLGTIYAQKNDFKKAHTYLGDAYSEYEKIGVTYRCISVLAHQSDAFMQEKNYPMAIRYGIRTMDMALEYNEPDLLRVAYGLLHTAYAGTNNYEKAYDYHVKYITLQDSLNQDENEKHLNELRTRFETEEKEKENRILANENQIQQLELNRNRYYVGGLIFLLLIGVLVAWLLARQFRFRSKQKAAELEQKLLRTQMNPHFIFNSLTSIQSYIYEHQPEEAGNYLARFAKLMRLILESSAQEYISLEKEVEILQYYLNLQKLRLQDHMTYTIEVDDELYDEAIQVPPMITQPFIENAVEHGLMHSEEPGEITVSFRKANEALKIEIRDNGIGIHNAMTRRKDKNHHSMAMSITKERLVFLNKSNKQVLSYEVLDLTQQNSKERGTHVMISIPLA